MKRLVRDRSAPLAGPSLLTHSCRIAPAGSVSRTKAARPTIESRRRDRRASRIRHPIPTVLLRPTAGRDGHNGLALRITVVPSQEELFIRKVVEDQLTSLGRNHPGQPKYEPPGFPIDWVYDRADPRMVLEVTSVRAEAEEAGAAERKKLESRLNRLLGSSGHLTEPWSAIVRATSDLRTLEALIVDLVKSGTEIESAYAADSRRYLALGLLSLKRLPGKAGIAVHGLYPTVEVAEDVTPYLAALIARKQTLLRKGRPRETHLALAIHRRDVARDPNLVALPDLGADIDWLWVFHPRALPDAANLWWHRSGDAGWSTATV